MRRLTIVLAATAIAMFMLAFASQSPPQTRGQTGVTCGQSYSSSTPDGGTITGQGCIGFGSGLTW